MGDFVRTVRAKLDLQRRVLPVPQEVEDLILQYKASLEHRDKMKLLSHEIIHARTYEIYENESASLDSAQCGQPGFFGMYFNEDYGEDYSREVHERAEQALESASRFVAVFWPSWPAGRLDVRNARNWVLYSIIRTPGLQDFWPRSASFVADDVKEANEDVQLLMDAYSVNLSQLDALRP